MTRKDFNIIAEIISAIGSKEKGELLEQARIACKYLEQTNEHFDWERFCKAVIKNRQATDGGDL